MARDGGGGGGERGGEDVKRNGIFRNLLLKLVMGPETSGWEPKVRL